MRQQLVLHVTRRRLAALAAALVAGVAATLALAAARTWRTR